ncbi:AzlD domain-containing protein [Sulfitobacter mediterraneus]|uniref:AzlD domain-containing protein n=1 Tax=Sulfitobacter mediterraneus TaxID=83219 RepID=UPI00193365EA|nr:AzlD domain-containing protein [Sulfitobacter mediterraneus]MBM1633653.1 AzlD domain-containing protein [Sulfitobacter mediterraneus]MBM1641832.1 AzlD domain-containing protein [Sulfitobacter mediterraneus]MBM1645517.1 AzlD domain-containing protein [Sulfitobacter mediterraneus]MBM1649951.1 AzlD domain-containing protein [Sulfitobacter mediterraneus]MBM1653586.1 AzlD domain-containing protein [Sulfitobacter mediterraneus]
MIDKTTLWIVIIALGIGSFFLRFVFTGFVGSRAMPDWLLRHLRYTAVAILPALVAPQVIWPQATGGETEPARLAAACVTLLVGLLSKNVIAAILSGAFTLYGLLYFLG